MRLLVLLLHLQLLLLLLAGGRECVLQQGGMCGPVGGMQVAKGVERVMQRHRMAAQAAQMVLQMMVQHRRRHSASAGTVMEVIAARGGRCGRAVK